MRKAVIAAIAVVAVVGGSAVAYSAYARHDGWGHGRAHFGRMNPDDRAAYADARIAALKAGLRLSAEQEKLWPPVESTLKDLAAKRITRQEERRAEWRERREQRQEARRDDKSREERRAEREQRFNPMERLRKGSERMTERGADLKRLADATEPLYNALDDGQKPLQRARPRRDAQARAAHAPRREPRIPPRSPRPRLWLSRADRMDAGIAARLRAPLTPRPFVTARLRAA
jgi:hypothetical protein